MLLGLAANRLELGGCGTARRAGAAADGRIEVDLPRFDPSVAHGVVGSTVLHPGEAKDAGQLAFVRIFEYVAARIRGVAELDHEQVADAVALHEQTADRGVDFARRAEERRQGARVRAFAAHEYGVRERIELARGALGAKSVA